MSVATIGWMRRYATRAPFHSRCETAGLPDSLLQPVPNAGSDLARRYARTHGPFTTDDFAHNVVTDAVDVHDLQATILRVLGIDHERLTYRFQGRRFRLTDVHGKVVKAVLA